MPAILGLLVAALLAVAGCGQDGPDATGPTGSTIPDSGSVTTVTTEPGSDEKTFTLDELAQYNGKDGAPAYVAVDGVVYDVTASQFWPEGEHPSCNLGAMAGRDLSEEIKQAPARMRASLQKMPVVGKLAQ